jgi:hypothetical protein
LRTSPATPALRRPAVLALSIVAIALGLVYVFVGDSTIWGEWISVAPPVVWAVLLLPSVVRLRSWTLLAFVTLFLLGTSEWPRIGGRKAPPAQTIRVVTWNIGAGNKDWAQAVRRLTPDIVLAQESMKPAAIDEGFRWYGGLDPGTLSRFPAEVLESRRIGGSTLNLVSAGIDWGHRAENRRIRLSPDPVQRLTS